jgi:hypothetical protein
MKNYILFISVLVLVNSTTVVGQGLYKSSSGSVSFLSDAPLELIKAKSLKLAGVLKTSSRTFGFKVPMKSFEGFNSALQRTHFNENYVESEKYPDATFEGKIIEEIDFNTPGKSEVRAKGKFTVHGVEQERIIKGNLEISKDKIVITSKFTVLLADHNIKIPSVVSKKITEEISVDIQVTLTPN